MSSQALSLSPARTDESAWAGIARHWSFTPGVTFLNHGSFGPPPDEVLETRQQLLRQLAQNPVDFMQRACNPRWPTSARGWALSWGPTRGGWRLLITPPPA